MKPFQRESPIFRNIRRTTWLVVVMSAIAAGCTPKQYAQQADRDAYAAVVSGQRSAFGQAKSFSIDYHPFVEEKAKPSKAIKVGKKVISVGSGPAQVLAPSECLEIAFRNSRNLQTRKEELFSAALALANSRRGWTWPLLGGEATGSAERSRIEKSGQWDNSAAAAIGPSLTQKFRNGAVLTLATTISLISDLLGSDSTTVGSMMEANFTQPLLQGAWRQLAYEDQYRLERDFVFDVYAYERFIQTFAVGIVNKYYDVLMKQDRLENERQSIERLKQTVAVTKFLVEGGQSRIQLDQAEQNLLDSQVRYELSRQNYRDALDGYKLELGLPVAAIVELDYPGVLKALNKAGPKPIAFKESDAIAVALATRPDVLTERAGVRDAERNIEIAADAFLPQLDVVLGYNAGGGPHKHDFWKVQFHRHKRFARVDFAWSLDQTDNRDAYRNSIMAFDRVRRDYDEFLDSVRLEVRQSFRSLVRSRRNYELQLRSVRIGTRRRKLAAMQQKGGEASARDVLEAEDALRSARNGLTRALIDYTTTRSKFLADLGMLRVDEKGTLHERTEPVKFERIEHRYPYAVVGR